ncbi:MAG: AAA+ family ATPase, partial [Alphaproteobacteria bacterium]
ANIEGMKRKLAIAALVALLAAPGARADDGAAPNPDIVEGANQLSEGFRLLLRGLMAESQKGWEDLVDWLSDLSLYEPPERLPNGDIIIRRKVPLEVPPPATDL